MRIYFLHRNQQFMGPYSLDEIRSLDLIPSDNIWKDGTPDVVRAESLEELACLFSPQTTFPADLYTTRRGGLSLGRFLGWRR